MSRDDLHLVPGNPEHPSRHSSFPAIMLQTAPCFHENVLNEVFHGACVRRETPVNVRIHGVCKARDELSRGLAVFAEYRGYQFLLRFGAAILLSVINGAVQGAVNSQNQSGSVSISPSTSTDVLSEVLRSTVNLPPTVTKAQGDRIQVFVARDVDFRAVYALRVANSGVPPEGKP